VHSALLAPLPYPDPDRLVMIWNQYEGKPSDNSPPDYFDRVEQSETLEHISAFRSASFNLTGEGEPERLEGAQVTASFFPTMGTQPSLGRVFVEEEDGPERGDVVVLSHGAWLRRFGGDRAAVGRIIRLNDRRFTILGVMPESFSLLFPSVELWAPMAFPPEMRADNQRGNENLLVMGRMKPGVTLGQTREEMATIAARVLDRVPSRREFLERANWSADAVSLHEQHAGDLRPLVMLLLGAVALVLLIANANVANLQLVRSAGRERELALRAAVGAGRGRIVRQLCVESLCLALVGGIPGVLVAAWGVQAFTASEIGSSPLLAQAQVNMPVLAFAFGLMLTTGLLFGLVPASALNRHNLHDALREGVRATPTSLGPLSRRALVVSEVAMALILVILAGLILQSFRRVLQVNPGFASDNRLTFQVSLPRSRYSQPQHLRQFHKETATRLAAIPGVVAVGTVQSLPIAGTGDTSTVHIEGRSLQTGEKPLSCEYRMISPDYLRAMSIPLLRGRGFLESDSAGRPLVVLISEEAARRYWPGGNAVGRRLSFGGENWREVVGVVATVRNRGLDLPGREQVYIPLAQNPLSRVFYVLHAQGTASNVIPAARATLRALDPDLPIYDIRTMEERLGISLLQRRLATSLLAGFAGAALLLSAIGIYGVISYTVRQGTRDIGIRVALGAQRGQVFRMVIGQGMALTALGLALGVAGAFAATRLLEQMLFEVRPHDAAAFTAGVVLLAAAAFLACWLPARRAMRVDPAIALRHE